MKKLLGLASFVTVLLTTLTATPAAQAVAGWSDGTHLKNGDTVWTKAYCQGGTHTHTWTLEAHPNAKVMTYVRNHHVCAFLSFPKTSKHHLMISFGKPAPNTYQLGWYKSYAGAIAAPANACRYVDGALFTSKGYYWLKSLHRVCG